MLSLLLIGGGPINAADFASGAIFILIACIPGYLMGLPFALLIKNLDGGRMLGYIVIGVLIGPVAALGEAFYAFETEIGGAGLDLFFSSLPGMTDVVQKFLLAAAISTLTTVSFLLILGRSLNSDTGESTSVVP
ncbi:MAG: hypothetical protein WAL45_21495 [Terracidiphilus sp.]